MKHTEFYSKLKQPILFLLFLSLILIGCTGCEQEHVHSWVAEITELPSCTKEGLISYSCSSCSAKRTEKVDATGHAEAIRTIKTEATCTQEGSYEDVCPTCKVVLESGIIEKKDHVPFPIKIQTEATCTEKGIAESICKECQAILGITEYPAKGHSPLEDWIVKVWPTCTTAGEEYVICKDCKETTDTRTIAALGHAWGDAVITKEPTCHTTGTAERTCSRCNIKNAGVIGMTQHTWAENYVENIPATCGTDGEGIVSCKNTGCSATRKIILPKTGKHNWEHNGERIPATEWAPAYEPFKCSECGEEKLEASGEPLTHIHKKVERIISKEANCAESGIANYYCDCWMDDEGNYYQEYSEGLHHYKWEDETIAVDPSVHKTVDTTVIPAGFTHGTLTDEHCTVCGNHKIRIAGDAVSMVGRWNFEGGSIYIPQNPGYPSSITKTFSNGDGDTTGIEEIFTGIGSLTVAVGETQINNAEITWNTEYCFSSGWQDVFHFEGPFPQNLYFIEQDTQNYICTVKMGENIITMVKQ